jgi:hypothetical protein
MIAVPVPAEGRYPPTANAELEEERTDTCDPVVAFSALISWLISLALVGFPAATGVKLAMQQPPK